jgi:hypothetical protein
LITNCCVGVAIFELIKLFLCTSFFCTVGDGTIGLGATRVAVLLGLEINSLIGLTTVTVLARLRSSTEEAENEFSFFV